MTFTLFLSRHITNADRKYLGTINSQHNKLLSTMHDGEKGSHLWCSALSYTLQPGGAFHKKSFSRVCEIQKQNNRQIYVTTQYSTFKHNIQKLLLFFYCWFLLNSCNLIDAITVLKLECHIFNLKRMQSYFYMEDVLPKKKLIVLITQLLTFHVIYLRHVNSRYIYVIP